MTCIAGVIGAPLVVWLMASGLDAHDAGLVMTRVDVSVHRLHVAGVAVGGNPRHLGRFAVPAATPVLLNVAMIAAAWLARRCLPIGASSRSTRSAAG